MSDIHSQPANDAYRDNWQRIYAQQEARKSVGINRTELAESLERYLSSLSTEDREKFNDELNCLSEYHNGCPILNEDANA